MSENSQASHVTPPPSARTDLITAAILLAFGLAVIVHAFQMPTFTATTGSAFTAPGIVPGFHGTIIALLSIALAARTLHRAARKPPHHSTYLMSRLMIESATTSRSAATSTPPSPIGVATPAR